MKPLKVSYLDRSCKEQELVVPEEAVGGLRITLSTGQYIEVELFEREEGAIAIRGEHTLVIRPGASNVIRVGVEV